MTEMGKMSTALMCSFGGNMCSFSCIGVGEEGKQVRRKLHPQLCGPVKKKRSLLARERLASNAIAGAVTKLIVAVPYRFFNPMI